MGPLIHERFTDDIPLCSSHPSDEAIRAGEAWHTRGIWSSFKGVFDLIADAQFWQRVSRYHGVLRSCEPRLKQLNCRIFQTQLYLPG